ncbi:MAG TPA: hypothetical protein VNS09_23400 [Solirubrobacter sp.]|nr:hypothetical protein [Solirubrobacter sp.]
MTTLETIQPYVEQLFDDDEVQRHLARARRNFAGARSRATRAKSAKQAAADRQLRRRVAGGLGAALDAAAAIKAAPRKRRRTRGRWLLVLAAGAVAILANPQARARLQELLGGPEGSSA